MAKKDFSDSTVMAILQGRNAPDDTPKEAPLYTPDNTPKSARQKSQTGEFTDKTKNTATPKHTPYNTPEYTPTETPDKPRMSFTYDSQAQRDRIKIQAEHMGKSVNRYLLDLALTDIARSDYMGKKKGGR